MTKRKYFIKKENKVYVVYELKIIFDEVRIRHIDNFTSKKEAKAFKKQLKIKEKDFQRVLRQSWRARLKILKQIRKEEKQNESKTCK